MVGKWSQSGRTTLGKWSEMIWTRVKTGRKNGPKATGDMLETWLGKRAGKCQTRLERCPGDNFKKIPKWSKLDLDFAFVVACKGKVWRLHILTQKCLASC